MHDELFAGYLVGSIRPAYQIPMTQSEINMLPHRIDSKVMECVIATAMDDCNTYECLGALETGN